VYLFIYSMKSTSQPWGGLRLGLDLSFGLIFDDVVTVA